MWRHILRSLRTACSETLLMIYGDLKKGAGGFYYYTVVVCQHTFMFKHIIIIIMVIICKTKHLNLKNNTTMVHREHVCQTSKRTI